MNAEAVIVGNSSGVIDTRLKSSRAVIPRRRRKRILKYCNIEIAFLSKEVFSPSSVKRAEQMLALI